LLLLSGGLAGLATASPPSAGFSTSPSGGAGESRLRFLAGVLLGVLASSAFFSSRFEGLPNRPFIAKAARATFRADSSASSAA